jgi:hypothetical protein
MFEEGLPARLLSLIEKVSDFEPVSNISNVILIYFLSDFDLKLKIFGDSYGLAFQIFLWELILEYLHESGVLRSLLRLNHVLTLANYHIEISHRAPVFLADLVSYFQLSI